MYLPTITLTLLTSLVTETLAGGCGTGLRSKTKIWQVGQKCNLGKNNKYTCDGGVSVVHDHSQITLQAGNADITVAVTCNPNFKGFMFHCSAGQFGRFNVPECSAGVSVVHTIAEFIQTGRI